MLHALTVTKPEYASANRICDALSFSSELPFLVNNRFVDFVTARLVHLLPGSILRLLAAADTAAFLLRARRLRRDRNSLGSLPRDQEATFTSCHTCGDGWHSTPPRSVSPLQWSLQLRGRRAAERGRRRHRRRAPRQPTAASPDTADAVRGVCDRTMLREKAQQ